MGLRLRECCRQGQAELVSNSGCGINAASIRWQNAPNNGRCNPNLGALHFDTSTTSWAFLPLVTVPIMQPISTTVVLHFPPSVWTSYKYGPLQGIVWA